MDSSYLNFKFFSFFYFSLPFLDPEHLTIKKIHCGGNHNFLLYGTDDVSNCTEWLTLLPMGWFGHGLSCGQILY